MGLKNIETLNSIVLIRVQIPVEPLSIHDTNLLTALK